MILPGNLSAHLINKAHFLFAWLVLPITNGLASQTTYSGICLSSHALYSERALLMRLGFTDLNIEQAKYRRIHVHGLKLCFWLLLSLAGVTLSN